MDSPEMGGSSSRRGPRRGRRRVGVGLATLGAVAVLAPSAYVGSVTAAPTHHGATAVVAKKKKAKPKPKKCKKGFVLRHGRCVSKVTPSY